MLRFDERSGDPISKWYWHTFVVENLSKDVEGVSVFLDSIKIIAPRASKAAEWLQHADLFRKIPNHDGWNRVSVREKLEKRRRSSHKHAATEKQRRNAIVRRTRDLWRPISRRCTQRSTFPQVRTCRNIGGEMKLNRMPVAAWDWLINSEIQV